jgi:hypothetical protein
VPAYSQHRLLLLPRQPDLEGRTTAADAKRAHRTCNPAKDRVICRANDRAIMMQKRVSYACEATLNIPLDCEHGLAADIRRSRDQWSAELLQ